MFDDDDDGLGGLGFEDSPPGTKRAVRPTSAPTPSKDGDGDFMSSLFGGGSSKPEKNNTTEKKEFVLDSRYSKSVAGNISSLQGL